MWAVGSSFDAQLRADGVFDTALLVINYQDGSQSCHSARRASAFGYDQRVELLTKSGELFVAQNPVGSRANHLSARGSSSCGTLPFSFPDRYADAYANEVNHFADMLLDGAPPRVSLSHNMLVAAVCDAAVQSAKTGRVQRIVIN